MVHTDYLWFETAERQEFIRITDTVAAIVKTSGIAEGMALVSAMHITSGVYVNDWEDGLIEDFQTWLEKLAPAGRPTSTIRPARTTPTRISSARSWGTRSSSRSPREARSGAVGTDLLRRVRRPAPQARHREGHG